MASDFKHHSDLTSKVGEIISLVGSGNDFTVAVQVYNVEDEVAMAE